MYSSSSLYHRLSSPCPHPLPTASKRAGMEITLPLSRTTSRYVFDVTIIVPSARALCPSINVNMCFTFWSGSIWYAGSSKQVLSPSLRPPAPAPAPAHELPVISSTPGRRRHVVGKEAAMASVPVPVHKRGSLKTRPWCQPKAARSFELVWWWERWRLLGATLAVVARSSSQARQGSALATHSHNFIERGASGRLGLGLSVL